MLRLTRPLSVAARRHLVSKPLASQVRGYAERGDSLLSSDPNFKSEVSKAPKSPEVPNTPPRPPTVITPPPPGKSATPSQPTPATPSTTSPATATTPTTPVTAAKTTTPSDVPTAGLRPPPRTSATAPAPTTAPPPPPVTPPPPPPTSKTWRRLRLLLWLSLVSALGYGGAVFFALRNDNFHDFFTEYVPFGEESVLFFEERAFRRKFPNAQANVYRSATAPKEESKRVKIPGHSGLSWKAVDDKKGSDLTQKGSHMSAVADVKAVKSDTKSSPDFSTTKEKSDVVSDAKADAKGEPRAPVRTAPSAPAPASPAKVETKPRTDAKKDAKPEAPAAPAPPSPAIPSPKSDPRPPVIAPVAAISNINIPNADEPVVQELVKIINDIITVVNADGADVANKYSAPMEKAKQSATAVASKISALRDAERAAAEERIKEMHKEFDDGARKLLEQVKTAQREEDVKYREEFEAERTKIADHYEQRLKAELARTEEFLTQKYKNELSEQGIKMKRSFIDQIHGLVESERDGRLSKLTDLTSNVDNLTQLTSNWNGIIDANLATQKLQVAVDAVRSALDNANATHKPTPFVREMAALKLIADSDPIVDAAVASINPAAYQLGIPSSAQLIDRFRRVANEVRKASLLPENAGVASHAASFVLSKVMFQKRGVPEGSDVESVLTRTETLLEEGDLDNAAREMNELKGWAGVLSRDWLNDARKVLEVKQALDVIETEARLQCLRVE